LTNNYFEKRQFWGIILKNNFGKQFLETTFGAALEAWGSRCSEKLSITILGSGFGEQLFEAGLGSRSSFEEKLCTAALNSSCEEALGTSFRTQLWGLLSALIVGSNFRELLWKIALGSSFGELLWGITLANFPEQFGGIIILKNNHFGEQFYI